MKYCRTCSRTYTDEARYCLDDGSLLSAVVDPEATLVRTEEQSWAPPKRGVAQSPLPWLPVSYRWIYPAVFLLTVLVGVSAGWFIYKFKKHTISTSSDTPSYVPTPTSGTQIPGPVTDKTASISASPTGTEVSAESLAARNLNGVWSVVNTVEKTSYQPFDNLRIRYRLIVSQSGTRFTAEGEKLLENGRPLTTDGRTTLHITGTIEGETIGARFVEEGAHRKTSGRFVWRLERDRTLMKGTFVSTAANSSGTSVATKEQ
jgi:hypothetical protein